MFGGGGSPEEFEDFPGSPGPGRRPAVNGRISGKVLEWKGRFGWIQADEPINHPEARMKGGKIFFAQEDVAEVISGVGANVSFYVYADGTGLGAMLCVPADSLTASIPHKKPASKTAPKLKAKSVPGRKRVVETVVTGKIKSWKGTFGFITPSSPVDHPLFTGSIFLGKADWLSTENPDAGSKVQFYLYADQQGLGAEECTIAEAEAAAPAQPEKPAAPGISAVLEVLGGGNNLFKSKPKAAAGGGSFVMPTAKAKGKAMMRATAKASSAAKAPPPSMRTDSDLAAKMEKNPELAKRLSAWMFDAGG